MLVLSIKHLKKFAKRVALLRKTCPQRLILSHLSIEGHQPAFSLGTLRSEQQTTRSSASHGRAQSGATAAAETIEVGGQDKLEGSGRDAELGKARRARCDHCILLQQIDLIAGERRLGQELHEQCSHAREPEWKRHQSTAAADLGEQELHEFAEAQDRWSA